MTTNITLTGASRKNFEFAIFNVDVGWNPVPGLYSFIDGNGSPKYIGETESYRDRPLGRDHPKWNAAVRLGAVFVAVHVLRDDELARKAAEADLIAAYNPPLNDQLRAAPAPGLGFGLGGRRLGATLLTGK